MLMITPVKVFKIDQTLGLRVVMLRKKGEMTSGFEFIGADRLLGVAARVVRVNSRGQEEHTLVSRPRDRAYYGIEFNDD
jgi:hypothetical protein